MFHRCCHSGTESRTETRCRFQSALRAEARPVAGSDDSSYFTDSQQNGKAFVRKMAVNERDDTYEKEPGPSLSDREREILRLVVHSFVNTAGPIGSRYLAKTFPLGLSPASIRNTMSDLEDMGYLGHPYTSAGRIPTEMGYRKFVDDLMESTALSPIEKQLLRAEIERMVGDTHEMVREGSRLLGQLSNLLGVALSPRLSTGVLDRLEIVPLSSTRVMFVLSVRGGLVKTIVLETRTEVDRERLPRVVSLLNERLAGLTLEELRTSFEPRIRDLDDEHSGIVRLVLNEASLLFSEKAESRRVRYSGTPNIMTQPEFQEPADIRNLIEMIEDEDVVVHLLEDQRPSEDVGRAIVTIGSEIGEGKADKCSIVTARYRLGDAYGTIGVIGPMRMNYGRVVALVEHMAAYLTHSADLSN